MRRELRRWQQEAMQAYLEALENESRSILWEATPGAGKTVAALTLCAHQLKTRRAKRVVIVVPTTHLKVQWARAAAENGIHLDSNYTDTTGRIASDYHGVVLTYQQIGMRPHIFRSCARNAVVVLDEVHHSGDGLSWGNALRIAFAESSFLLCLSGTAFRSDNNKIPFVHYNEAGVSQPQYVYNYSRAVEDSVCRPTVFFTFGGEVSWSSGATTVQADFTDALDKVGRTRRLRAALDPKSGWIEPMLREAHSMLLAVRKEQPNAAGLVAASSQRHARALAKVLTTVSGTAPSVILSEDTLAAKRLKTFTQGKEPWLVACNMVSEGVDIPRLRVGVYATTVRTKMYFRQFLGRIVRRTPTPRGVQPAFFYLPADPWLTTLAQEVEEEQRHCIAARSESEFDQFAENPERERPDPENDSFEAFQGRNSGIASVITGGGQLSLWGDTPESSQEQFEIPPPLPTHESNHHERPQFLSRAELKEAIAREVRMLVAKHHQDSGTPHSHIHALLNRKQSVKSQKECTEGQLRERLKLLEQLIENTDGNGA